MTPDPDPGAAFLAALAAALAADASDEATYDLLSVTFDEDAGGGDRIDYSQWSQPCHSFRVVTKRRPLSETSKPPMIAQRP